MKRKRARTKYEIELIYKQPMIDILKSLYHGNQVEVAQILMVSQSTVSRWLADCGIPTQKKIERLSSFEARYFVA